jgi:serine/threonine protein kinase/formylglycine-generating enzyme required for sulfatase activity
LNFEDGQKLASCYVLKHRIVTGGDEIIWAAEDEVLGKAVSLHFLPETVRQDDEAMEDLRQEVRRNRPLIHPNILRVYDLVEEADWAAIAMDGFEGQSLAALLRKRGRLEAREVEPWMAQLCATLEEAHKINLMHRELSPENLFLDESGKLLVANFGISRVIQDALNRAAKRTSRNPRLSALSPQLIFGHVPAPTDDVYGVGALIFQLLTGEPVFSRGDVAEQVRQTVPARISQVRAVSGKPGAAIPPAWDDLVAACLLKAGEDRPATPKQILAKLGDLSLLPEEPFAVEEPEAEAVVEVPAPAVREEPEAAAPEEVMEEPPAEATAPSVLKAETLASERAEPGESPAPAVEPPFVEHAEQPVESAVFSAAPTPDVPVSVASEPTPLVPAPPVHEPKPSITVLPMAVRTPRRQPAPHQLRTENRNSSSRKFWLQMAAALAVAALIIMWFGQRSHRGGHKSLPAAIATTDPAERSELTSVKNSIPVIASEKPEPPARLETRNEHPAPASIAPVEPPKTSLAVQPALPSEPVLLAAGPVAKTPAKPANSPASEVALDDQAIADKAASLEKLKQQAAAAEKAHQDKLKELQTAEAALADAQKTIDQKTKAAGPAKKAADDFATARKKKADEQKTAEAAAQQAQQLAAEKARVAEDARKALADFEAQNQEKLAAQERAEAEILALQRTLAERQRTATEAAKAAAASDLARQQQVAVVKRTEQEVSDARAASERAAADSDRKRQAVESERRKLDDEISAMKAMFEQKMKEIDDRRRQLENPGAAAPAPAAARAERPLPPAPEVKPATPALLAMKTTATPEPVAPPPASTASSFENSLGMKFVPVGDVSFCIWQTRVKDFENFAKATSLKSTAWRGPGFRQGPDHPVVNVTWNEAIAFCKWLTEKERKEGGLAPNQFYRLPYDPEWSKAVGLPEETGRTPEARDMGVPDLYPWGTDWPPPKGAGNYTGEETGSDVAIRGYDDGFAWTAPVGSFAPNKLGIFDMGGNVWQWCMDSWNNESKAKVLRGASWYNGALKLSLLSSCRVHAAPDSSTDNYGFRIVRATETPTTKAGKK